MLAGLLSLVIIIPALEGCHENQASWDQILPRSASGFGEGVEARRPQNICFGPHAGCRRSYCLLPYMNAHRGPDYDSAASEVKPAALALAKLKYTRFVKARGNQAKDAAS
jgi:hypothetical protein